MNKCLTLGPCNRKFECLEKPGRLGNSRRKFIIKSADVVRPDDRSLHSLGWAVVGRILLNAESSFISSSLVEIQVTRNCFVSQYGPESQLVSIRYSLTTK
jgi:hypothetical protein